MAVFMVSNAAGEMAGTVANLSMGMPDEENQKKHGSSSE